MFDIACINKRNSNSTLKVGVNENTPIVFDSTSIMRYSADCLLLKNGKPVSDIKFPAFRAASGKRVIFQFFDSDSNDTIRELKWNINDSTYLLIWYSMRDSMWLPFTFNFRDIWTDY